MNIDRDLQGLSPVSPGLYRARAGCVTMWNKMEENWPFSPSLFLLVPSGSAERDNDQLTPRRNAVRWRDNGETHGGDKEEY